MNPLVRLDRFSLTAASRAVLLARIAETHALLRWQPGFVRDVFLERRRGDRPELVTYAEWASSDAAAAAREVVAAHQAATGFDRAVFLARHGIEAEFTSYDALPRENASPAA